MGKSRTTRAIRSLAADQGGRRVWRMAMRAGSQGPSVWPQCFEREVAAITYGQIDDVDLSEYPEGEPKERWDQLTNSSKGFLRRVVYDMSPGDIIYVKDGRQIVGRGVVTGPYKYDAAGSIFPAEFPEDRFVHQVPVDWEQDFVPVDISLGSEISTVLELKGDRLRRLETAVAKVYNPVPPGPEFTLPEEVDTELPLKEGATRTVCVNCYERNSLARQRCIDHYGPTCVVCGFSFGKVYGEVGEEYTHVHHLRDLAAIGEEYEVDPIEDLRPVCANCHAMLHQTKPAMSIEELERIVAANRQ